MISVRAPAKVNLYLAVGPLRPDGYHDVQTVLHALELADVVRLEPADHLSVTAHPSLDVAEQENTAYRAARALADVAGHEPTVSITIDKRIPDAAGLAGGSSDAAAVLWGLCRMWGLDPRSDAVMRVASSVGMDVPFFLVGGAAHFDGRGERLVRPLVSVDTPIVLVNPGVATPTPHVYRAFDHGTQSPAPGVRHVADAIRARDIDALGAAVYNGLAAAAASVAPEIEPCLEWLTGQDGVVRAEVSGSGATVFGICRDAPAASAAAAAAAQRGWWSEATRTSGRGVHAEEGDAA